MGPRASAHAVYDLKYHFVWVPKYRRGVLVGEVAEAAEEILMRVAEAYDIEIDEMEVMPDHVHLFLLAPPRHAPARVAQILKSLSARELFQRYPWLRQKLWGGEFWGDGYFVRTVGDEVTAEVVRKYIRYQKRVVEKQLTLWDD